MLVDPPIFIALDLADRSTAIEMAKEVAPYVGGFKIGPRLCVKYGADMISELAELGQVFVDNKYFDIPSSMEAAIRTTFQGGASFTTVHGTCGPVALKRLAQVEKELCRQREFRILAVTVLTSFHAQTLPVNWSREPIASQVAKLACEVVNSGLSGLVCSPHEVRHLRALFPKSFLLTPGIRFQRLHQDRSQNQQSQSQLQSQGQEQDQDQVRVLGPGEAIAAGASALVVGRPIYEAKDPREAAKKFCEAAKTSVPWPSSLKGGKA